MDQLNEQQLAAINSSANKILVNAGVGTGKTSTLIGAAQRHKDKKIALITFTNEAADEMKRRLTFNPFFIGTIHRFAYELLVNLSKKYGFKLNLLRDYQITSTIDYIAAKNDFSYQDSIEAQKYISDKKYYAQNHITIPPSLQKIEEEYSKLKKDVMLYDLTDSPLYLLEKLKQYKLDLDIEWLFVDEAQDLSEDQYELIEKLNIPNKFIIGDPAQSIYMFRGADGLVFDKFKQNGYKEYPLIINYRSYQELLDFANTSLQSDRGTGGIIYSDIKEIIKLKPQILCRSNVEVQKIQKYYKNVSTIHAAKGLEYDNVIVIPFLLNSEEEKNIYYVALTRARNGIGIFNLNQVLHSVRGK